MVLVHNVVLVKFENVSVRYALIYGTSAEPRPKLKCSIVNYISEFSVIVMFSLCVKLNM